MDQPIEIFCVDSGETLPLRQDLATKLEWQDSDTGKVVAISIFQIFSHLSRLRIAKTENMHPTLTLL